MSDKYLLIPMANPVHFVQENIAATPSNPLEGLYDYASTARPSQIYKPYDQPWVQGDKINLQFWRKEIAELYIEAVDCTGKILGTFKQNPYAILYTETDNGNGTQDVTFDFAPPAGLVSLTIAWQDGSGALNDFTVGITSPQTITIPTVGNFRYRLRFNFASRSEYYYTNLLVSTALVLGNVAYDIHQFEIDSDIIAVGQFWLRLRYRKSGNTVFEPDLVSEPQYMHSNASLPPATLRESVLFAYYNSFNEYNTVYQTPYGSGFSQVFYMRVEGYVVYEAPENNRVSYDDQRMSKTLLDAKPYDTYRFRMGGNFGLPPWMAKKMNMVISHDRVFCDGIQWAFIEKWEQKAVDGYGRAYYTILAQYAQIDYYNAFGGRPADGTNAADACDIPGDITITEITSTSVHIDWSVGTPNGLGFDWELYEAANPGIPVFARSTLLDYVDINGLQPGTAYIFQVRSICSGNTFSNWANPSGDPDFTTLP